MRAIKGRGTKPELQFAAAMTAAGLEFDTQGQGLPGTPDFVFWDEQVAVFVDGDFWHGAIWKATGKAPKTNQDRWIAKFKANIARDERVDEALRRAGWVPIRVLESHITKDVKVAVAMVAAVVNLKY